MSKRKQRVRSWSAAKAADPDAAADARSRRPLGLLAAVLALVLAAPALAVAGWFLFAQDGADPGPPRAVIVDQLSLSYPNPEFVEEATATLEAAGYAVDYVPGEDVNISLYYNLPTHDYEYVILRSHQAQLEEEWRGKEYDEAVFFTTELYDETEYTAEQWELELSPAHTFEGATRYFAIAANFIEDRMQGDLDGATVILMGCGGLHTERTAEAFVQRGASRVIGWDHLVSASHTDAATERLLEQLLIEDQSMEAALAQTMAEIGPDPGYRSTLVAYPPPFPAEAMSER